MKSYYLDENVLHQLLAADFQIGQSVFSEQGVHNSFVYDLGAIEVTNPSFLNERSKCLYNAATNMYVPEILSLGSMDYRSSSRVRIIGKKRRQRHFPVGKTCSWDK